MILNIEIVFMYYFLLYVEVIILNINYQKKLGETINNLDYIPKLLLHSCCGPCSTAVIERLKEYADITIIYYNPNIEPIIANDINLIVISPKCFAII